MIQTPAGKRLLADGITALASSKDGSGVTFRSLSGFIPFRFGVGEFKISDAKGDWLVAENISLRMDPGNLLLFRLRAEEVTVGRVTWRRLPAGSDVDKEEKKPGEGFAPRDIPSFTVERLWIKSLIAEESLPGKRIVAELKGHVRNDSADGASVTLALKPRGRDGDNLAVAGTAAADLSSLALEITLNEKAGGNLGSLFIPGADEPISLQLHGGGPWEACRVRMSGRAGASGKLDLDITLNLARILAEGTLKASFTGLLGMRAAGQGSGNIFVRLADSDGGQDISAQIEASGVQSSFGGAGHILASLDAHDLLRSPRGTIKLLTERIDYRDTGAATGASAGEANSVAARCTFGETEAGARAEMEARISGCTLPGTITASNGTHDLTLRAVLENKKLRVRLSGKEDTDFFIKADLTAGAEFSLAPFAFRLDEDGPLGGDLSARLDLSFLNNRLALSRQSLRGTLSADLTAGGTIRKPEINGEISLREGEYQNLNTGTVLTSLAARLKIETDVLVLEELTARTPPPPETALGGWARFIPGVSLLPHLDQPREAPKEGEISLIGRTKLSPAEGFPSAYSLRIRDALLADMDILTATASGEIDFDGNLEGSRLKGKLTIKRAEGRIPSNLSSGVPEIEVTEINKPGETAAQRPPASSPFLKTVALDLHLTAPEDIFITGRGLDSEWKADVTATGTADAPSLRGGITLLDGIFIFMGEELKLENCSIMMSGGFPPMPQLKINARVVKSDITITLQIVGPVNAPEVILSSQPSYPADEILARLLYGRPASQLTGLQALRIADGLRTLQGKGGLFDRLTGWTSFLGNIQVDFTELEGSTDQTAVRVRWSLSKNFYVENQHSIDARDNLFLARWDLTRRLQLRTQSGYGFLGDAAYLRYQWDY